MADHEIAAAVDAITRKLRDRDPGADDEVFAREILAMLQGRGWRPTEAKPPPAWKHPVRSGGLPRNPEVIDLARETHAALVAKAGERFEPGDGAA